MNQTHQIIEGFVRGGPRKLTCTVLIYINHNIDLCANAGVFMDSSYLDIYHIECINCSTL